MASSSRNNKYDVFVSFRGEDTRDNITSHLYSALSRQNIQTFIDDQLSRGNEISESLVKAIEASAISVIIFSEGYASSRWCLNELVKILECKKEYAHIVIPVFYRVDPSDVRNQTGSFGVSFLNLEESFKENSEKVQSWRNALKEAASLCGFNSLNIRPESKLINEVVNHILKRLTKVFWPRDSKTLLVGIESRVEEIESLLGVESRHVYALGLWGFGGIGKTTIAKAIFEKISSDFEGSCFLENVREESQRLRGLACLRQKLLSNILNDKNVIPDMDLNFRRLSSMKVLIVFDDVTCFSQLESLIGSLEWLTPVSRIIITTRNKQVLRNCGVRKVYEMGALEYHHALELFSRHAFKKNHPDVGYEELSSKVMKYAQGVPLALKVLGCFLFEREKEVWKSAIKKLKSSLHPSIQEVLRISYDGLDHKEKNIFLDVACFFKGENVYPVMKFLDASGFYPEIGTSVLVDKSLIVISNSNRITMHDLLQELGRDIVRQESNTPGNRSRLWHHEDIYEVLTYNTGTEKIEGICLDMSKVKEIRINTNTFTTMHKLRFLKFYSSSFNGENKCKVSYLQDPGFAEVRYFHWHGYPLNSLPSNINSAEKLAVLEMPNSNIEQLWDGVKHHGKINQIMHAVCNKLITKAPNPSLIPHLNKLAILNLRGSKSLKSLPAGIFNLEFLTDLDLSGCSSLNRLPEISSGNISWLFLKGTAIEELPSSIELLLRLEYLDLSDCKRLKSLPSSICKLKSLELLDLKGCLSLQRLPECLGQLSSPIKLNIVKTNIERIPESIIQLFGLGNLFLSYCERRQFFVRRLDPDHFAAMQSLSGFTQDALRIQHRGHLAAARWKKIQEKIGFSMGKVHIVLLGNEIPKWFKFQSVGSFITLEMPPDFFNKNRILGFAFSAILAFSSSHVDCGTRFLFSCELKVKTTKDCHQHDTRLFQSRVNYIELDHLHLGYYLFCEEDLIGFWKCNCVPKVVHFNVVPSLECECCGVKKCGIHLIHTPTSTDSIEDPSRCFNCNEEV